MVPVSATEKVKITKDDEIEIVNKETGISTIKKTVPFHNLEQWAKDMSKKHREINAMKDRNEWFAFKISGHRSHRVFPSIGELIKYLREYTAFQGKRKDQAEFFQALEIVRLPDPDRKKWQNAVDTKQRLKRSNPKAFSTKSKQERAAWQRRFRASLSGKALERYKKAAKERAKKSRQKRKR